MSAFDLPRIVDSLQSTRVKQRNESLILLTSFAPSKLKLSAKQFTALLSGLISFIGIERNIYANNPTTATEQRLLNASAVLNDVLEECLRSSSLRYKHCVPVFQGAMEHFFLPGSSNLLLPCVLSLAKVMNSLLRKRYFLTHLTADIWSKALKFLRRSISTTVDQMSRPGTQSHFLYESVLTDLMNSLYTIIGGDTPSNYAQLLADKEYVSFYPIIEKTFHVFSRRESSALINAFKIIIKLLKYLLTEDFRFCSRLVRLSVQYMITFSSTSVEPLLHQFGVLLNMNAFHKCIDVSFLPKLIQNEPICDSPEEELDHIMDIDLCDSYSLGVLLQALVSRLIVSSLKLEDNDFLTLLHPNNLEDTKTTSDKSTFWLLHLATVKLMISFYELEHLPKDTSFSLDSFKGNSNKRIKLQNRNLDPWSFQTPYLFLSSMIRDGGDPRVQNFGLISLALLFNLHPIKSDIESRLHAPSDEDLKLTIQDESTVLDLNFHSSEYDNDESLLVLGSAIKALNNKTCTLSALLACHSYLINFSNSVEFLRSKQYLRRMGQIAKMSLLLIKDKTCSSLACLVFSSVIFLYPKKRLEEIADRPLLAQVENLMDLSEVSGPSVIDNNAFRFWWAINIVVSQAKDKKATNISISAGRWLLAKWNDLILERYKTPADGYMFPIDSPQTFALFILWLGGQNLRPHELIISRRLFNITPDSDEKHLQSFMFLESTQDKLHDSHTIEIPYCDGSEFIFNTTIERICNLCSSIANGEEKSDIIVRWAITITTILFQIRKHKAGSTVSLENSSMELWRSLGHTIQEKEQAILVMKQLVENPLPLNILDIPDFPLEKLCSFFRANELRRTPSVLVHQHQRTFDDEFSSPSGVSAIPEIPESMLDTISGQVEYFTFLLTYCEGNIMTPADFLTKVEATNTVTCFKNLLNSPISKELLKKTPLTGTEKLVRLLGEGPLQSHLVDREDETIWVIRALLQLVLPQLKNTKDSDLAKDCLDLVNFLFVCGQKNLLLTESAQVSLLQTCLCTLTVTESEPFKAELLNYFLEGFEKCSNQSKAELVGCIKSHFGNLDSIGQMNFYGDTFKSFKTPQESVEKAATFCYFISSISSASMQIRVSALYNLIECSSFEFFLPYLKKAVSQISSLSGQTEPLYLFRQVKLEILKFWWVCGQDAYNFPYTLFGINDLQIFIGESYKELCAIAIAVKSDNGDVRSQRLLSALAQARLSDKYSLVCDALPLLVPLAYTSQGTRNNVFKSLVPYLNDAYKQVMKEKLLLLVLNTIKLTDVSQESPLRKTCSHSKWSYLLSSGSYLDTISQASISPTSSFDLINALVSKFWRDESYSFWNVASTYFILRQLGQNLHLEANDYKMVHYRRIKYTLCLCDIKTTNFKIDNLILEISVLLIEANFFQEAFELILIVKPSQWHDLDINQGFLSLAKILVGCEIASNELIRQYNWPRIFLSWLQASTQALGSASPLIEASLMKIMKKEKNITSSMLEKFLADDDFKQCIHRNPQLTVDFLLFLYSDDSLHGIKTTNVKVVSLLIILDIGGKNFGGFEGWASSYLANHFINGLVHENAKDLIPRREYTGFQEADVHKSASSLDFLVTMMRDAYRFADFETATFLECIFGAMLSKSSSSHDFAKTIDTSRLKTDFQSYLVSLDFHTCFLAISNDNDEVIQGKDLESWIESAHDLFLSTSFEQWSKELVLLIVQELAAYTNVATLLASLVLRLPSIGRDAAAGMICNYIRISPVGSTVIKKLVDALCDNRNHDSQTLSFLCNVVLHIRIGARSKMKEFETLYDSLDLARIFRLIRTSKMSKSALMILEDSLDRENTSFNWDDNRTSMMELYESIDDVDLLFGVPDNPSLLTALHMIEQTGSSSEKLKNTLALFNSVDNEERRNKISQVSEAMVEDGLLGTASLISDNTYENSKREWFWKMGEWDIPVTESPKSGNETIFNYFKRTLDPDCSITKVLDSSLRELHQIKSFAFQRDISEKQYSRNLLSWFSSVASIVAAHDAMITEASDVNMSLTTFTKSSRWFEKADIELSEDILMARQTAFSIRSNEFTSVTTDNRDLFSQAMFHEILRYNNIACINGHSQKILNSAVLLDKITNDVHSFVEPDIAGKLKKLSVYRSAHSLWTQGTSNTPITMLKSIEGDDLLSGLLQPLNLSQLKIKSQLVNWLSESCQDLGLNIMRDYVDPVEPLIESVEDLQQRTEVYQSLARFCEQQYKMNSLRDQIFALNERIKSKQTEVNDIKNHYGKTSVTPSEKKIVQKYYNRLKNQRQAEMAELEDLMEIKATFARKATVFYLQELLLSAYDDEDADRFFSLFLELAGDRTLQTQIMNLLCLLPSHQALNWCSQLMARLSDDQTDFQVSTQKLILRVCQDYPYHSLYMLLSLIYHESAAEKSANSSMLSRVQAAKLVRDQLMASSSLYRESLLFPIEKFCTEAIQLAAMKSSKGKTIHLDKLQIGDYWINELPNIPPPTLTVPSVPLSQSQSLPRMVGLDVKVNIANSGLSLPKIMTLKLSDGSQHKMLLKSGTDDLRQDATMEQVFGKVNKMLAKDKETRKRRLRVRTYNAVPLGPKAGVIEFVAHSKAFIEIVKPYHQKFDNMKSEKAREMMKEVQTSDHKQRKEIYDKITSKIHPVLRHYFADNFMTPDSWFESRLVYTRGVASSSMIGHILGLGDRHCNNILLDEFTGEPIHIDLGVAFDQGKRLPIPETVPFRLTRDIVNGFGITGTRGVFTKLCEHTFRVLQQHREQILAIVDALRWDPLHSWSISPIRKKKLQDGNDQGDMDGYKPQEDGSEASTAVLTVLDKLNARNLSVDATVRELIREATSEQNLALIYCGWCPFF